MAVYVANFGEKNYEWDTCRERGTIATMNEVTAQDFWMAGDREGYIQNRLQTMTAAGNVPTRAVASRWFNLMSIIAESVDDFWIHSDGKRLWWTKTVDQQCSFETKTEPVGRQRDVIVCHKPCENWKSRNLQGASLLWNSLHPKAKDFLSTEATFQQLNDDYARYTIALVEGGNLNDWHFRQEWQNKVERSKHKSGATKIYNRVELAAYQMAETAFKTTANSNGQIVERSLKNKDMKFSSKSELTDFLVTLLNDQDYCCALSGIRLNLDNQDGNAQLRASLDRIDSNAHYEQGNLQVVCRFINRWKGAEDNDQFRQLLELTVKESVFR